MQHNPISKLKFSMMHPDTLFFAVCGENLNILKIAAGGKMQVLFVHAMHEEDICDAVWLGRMDGSSSQVGETDYTEQVCSLDVQGNMHIFSSRAVQRCHQMNM